MLWGSRVGQGIWGSVGAAGFRQKMARMVLSGARRLADGTGRAGVWRVKEPGETRKAQVWLGHSLKLLGWAALGGLVTINVTRQVCVSSGLRGDRSRSLALPCRLAFVVVVCFWFPFLKRA